MFSVIIPAHNEENYLSGTLHSIRQQSCQDFETIVVANGCTDKTEEIAKKRSNVRVLSLPRANVSVARNAGALNAKGEILVFLDADTRLEEDSLKKIKEEFTEEYAVLAARVRPDNQNLKYKLLMSLKNVHNITGIYKATVGIFVCRKKDFQKAEGYDPEMTIREHQKLRQRLFKIGKYKCINSYVTTSTRRYEQLGLPKVLSYWTKQFFKEKFGNSEKNEYERIR